jgi:hypothetical protein
MPVFAAEFSYTPDEFRALSMNDYIRLSGWLVERQKRMDQRRGRR